MLSTRNLGLVALVLATLAVPTVGHAVPHEWVVRGPRIGGSSLYSSQAVAVSSDGSSVVVANGRQAADQGRRVIAYDGRTGAVRWDREDHPPAAEEIWFAAGDARLVGAGMDGRAYGADPHTGDVLWVGTPTTDRWASAALSDDGTTLFITGSDGGVATLSALDTSDGSLRWRKDGIPPSGRLRAHGDRVIVFDGGSLGSTINALSATDGSNLWSTVDPGWLIDVTVGAGGIFATGRQATGSSSKEYDVLTIAYDPSNGALLWRRVTDRQVVQCRIATYPWCDVRSSGAGGYAIVVAGGTDPVVAVFERGSGIGGPPVLTGFRASDGVQVWQHIRDTREGLAAVGDRIYQLGEDFSITATDAASGLIVWAAAYQNERVRSVLRARSFAIAPTGTFAAIAGNQSSYTCSCYGHEWVTAAYCVPAPRSCRL